MALIVEDRVLETTTTTGTGALTLAGAITGFKAFSSVMTSPSDTCYYMIEGVDGNGALTAEWETGLGTYSASNTLTRTTVSRSSNANAAVNFAAGTKRVSMSITKASVYGANESLSVTYAATITLDGSLARNFHTTLTGNVIFANPTNMVAGQSGRVRVTQDGTGSRTATFGANWLFAGGDPTLSTTAAAIDVIAYYCHSSSSIEATFVKGLS